VNITLTASTTAKIVVWKEGDLYHARRLDVPERPQVCLAVDLFEVIAELAGLDLEHAKQASEATSLAERVQAALNNPSSELDGDDDPLSDADEGESSTTCGSAP